MLNGSLINHVFILTAKEFDRINCCCLLNRQTCYDFDVNPASNEEGKAKRGLKGECG
jgi:hypothetical protein